MFKATLPNYLVVTKMYNKVGQNGIPISFATHFQPVCIDTQQVFRERETSGPYVPKPIFIFVPLFLTQEDCSSLSHVNNRARR